MTPEIVLAGSGGAATGGGAASDSRLAVTPATATPGSFRISGGTDGLFPGASRPLVLTVTNPQAFGIVVTSIATAVGSPSASCPGALLTIPSFSGQLAVPPRGEAQVALTATLSHGAPDACQGAVFPLTYTGLARKG